MKSDKFLRTQRFPPPFQYLSFLNAKLILIFKHYLCLFWLEIGLAIHLVMSMHNSRKEDMLHKSLV